MTDDANLSKESGTHNEFSQDSIYLISYPKIVFLYPTLLVSIAAAIYMTFAGESAHIGGPSEHMAEVMALIFLGVFGLNLTVLAFDFPRTTSLTLFFLGAALFMGVWMILRFNPDIIPPLTNMLKGLRPWANSQMYWLFSSILGLIFVCVGIYVRFDYWEVKGNELLHHHGFLSDLERFSAPNLKIDKEISDIFEYILLRSGRLVLHPRNEPRAIVLDNVPFISKKEKQITRMLGALQVQVRTDNN
ncbi:hypothetical protein [Gimesia maris]|jgi:hypothetical protein|uniref:Uncharacterized protein n=1 Tax=Gimesia maris TaxID=122 RepID=A0ABX5YUL7_9PLAN|nr:hypothetical protein [Gimesia maris]EDL57390.1 hypothetical protein PM8797T_14244 [Gimesia maris DSM 8797]QEG19302.1 hypothetical protein GmarT_52000 [Gimesia maris]|tara:strand:- start:33539 stop:34276 length:738 start_codon:yes stop_codon:yes gene_type:complete